MLSRYLIRSNGLIDMDNWEKHRKGKQPVGKCNALGCDGDLLAVTHVGYRNGQVLWIGAECSSCYCEIGQRADVPPLPRTALRSHMPAGAFERRTSQMKAGA